METPEEEKPNENEEWNCVVFAFAFFPVTPTVNERNWIKKNVSEMENDTEKTVSAVEE